MASYIEESLGRDEEVVRTFEFHWTAWILFWVCLLFFWTVILAFVAISEFIRLKTTERGVTTRRVIQKRGWISRRTDEMKLSSIETVEIRQGILGRIFGFGTIKVTGRGISDVVMRQMDDPMAVKRAIEDAAYDNP